MSGAVGHDRALAGRYAIERELGRGGMGVVYLARDLHHRHRERRVAIKFLPSELASTVGSVRFDQEIQTLASLTHPHILGLIDSGDADGELYYVMPLVEGESLRERLDREGPMRVRAALQIARQVADALAYAHAHTPAVVHRDIKPENILLDRQGHAWVSDFGIARVLEVSAEGSRYTSVSMRMGSPPYMSPEQIAGEARIDGRSDLYSLGCVLFEMLAGQPPFADHRPQVVMRRHLVDAAPSLRDRRADIGPGLDRIVASLLAKQPEERCASADVLLAALDAELARITGEDRTPVVIVPQPPERWPRRAAIAAVGVVALFVVALVATANGATPWFRSPPLDAERLLVLPLDWASGSLPSAGRAEDLRLYAAFDRWNDLELVPRVAVEQAIRRRGGSPEITASVGLRLARDFGAGRVIRGIATRMGDSLRLDLTLSGPGGQIERLSTHLTNEDGASAYSLAVDSLLFGRVTWDSGPESEIGTRSAAARQAYGLAYSAMERWDLDDADEQFERTLSLDPGFARAAFWLAQVRNWRGEATETYAQLAANAVARSTDLTPREHSLARALVQFSSDDLPSACTEYETLLEGDQRDAIAWLGLGACQRWDNLTIRDPSSTSGWRFRSSFYSALQSYVRAFIIEPRAMAAYRSGSFERLREIFGTRSNFARYGRNTEGRFFAARPEWRGDSLSFVPIAWNFGALPPKDEELHDEALRQQRRLFLEVCERWVSAEPNHADALHAMALAQEINGDAIALTTLARARAMATDPGSKLALDIRWVWTTIKIAGNQPERVASVRALADSLVDSALERPASEYEALAALATLIGRPTAAADLSRRASQQFHPVSGLPASVMRPAAALIAYAATGHPRDSIVAAERQLRMALARALPPDQRAFVRGEIERARILGAAAFPPELFVEADTFAALVARGWAAHMRADTAATQAALRQIQRRRPAGVAAGDLTPDVMYSEAALWAAVGDSAQAERWIKPTLEGLAWIQPGILDELPNAGSLVRSMMLLAEIAAARNEMVAAHRWARVVVLLWGPGEPHVQADVAAMRSLLARGR